MPYFGTEWTVYVVIAAIGLNAPTMFLGHEPMIEEVFRPFVAGEAVLASSRTSVAGSEEIQASLTLLQEGDKQILRYHHCAGSLFFHG